MINREKLITLLHTINTEYKVLEIDVTGPKLLRQVAKGSTGKSWVLKRITEILRAELQSPREEYL